VPPFAEALVANHPVTVDEVQGQYRLLNARQISQRLSTATGHSIPRACTSRRTLSRFCSNSNSSVSPGADVRERAEPVDAGVRAEVDEDDASLQVGRRQRLGVERNRSRRRKTGSCSFGEGSWS
jgi:hypothetical protein